MTESSRQKLQLAKDQIVPLLKSVESLGQIGIYGSVARGTARPDSDIDLIVVCGDNALYLTRWQVNWRLWRARFRGRVSAGVVVTESALKPETFQINERDEYTDRWFKDIKWIYQRDSQFSILNFQFLNWLAKQYFWLRFRIDQLKSYPVPYIKFSDQVFFHFGDSKAKQNVNIS